MDLGQEELEAWQKYFVSRGLKQPFEQIWEPVVEQSCVTPDRYAGCRIPYYRFAGREKHGIHVEDWNFHEDIDIYFEDCEAAVNRIDRARHAIEMEHRFEVETITYKKFTRKVNHILAYLDKVTILERIKQDDVSVAAFLPRFTLAQIGEFIQAAAQNHCTNVTAVLLDYRNRSFADVDPMAEFSLDL